MASFELQESAPYSKDQERTLELSRLQAACGVLRKVTQLLYLTERFKSLLEGGRRDSGKIAEMTRTISEIDEILQGSDLVGIKVNEKSKAMLKKWKDVESQAKKMLSQGLELSVHVAVQVFQSMDQFQNDLVSFVYECNESTQKELDPSTRAPTSTPDQVSQGSDLVGIEKDNALLNEARKDVKSQAKLMLFEGLEFSNLAQVRVAVQVLQSMDQLQNAIVSFLVECNVTIQKQIVEALATQGGGSQIPGRAATMPTVGSTAPWTQLEYPWSRDKAQQKTLWTRLKTLADQIERTCLKVQQLQMVLEKDVNPVSGQPLLDQLKKTTAHEDLMSFWSFTVGKLAAELTKAAKVSPFLNEVFEADYPRLVLLFVRLLQRLDQQMKGSGHTSQSTGDRKGRETVLVAAFTIFEMGYLQNHLSKLSHEMDKMFCSLREPPGEQEVRSFVLSITDNFRNKTFSEQFSLLIAENVRWSLDLFVMSCKDMKAMDLDSMQLVSRPDEVKIIVLQCLVRYLDKEIFFSEMHLPSTVLERLIMDTMKNAVEQGNRYLDNLLEAMFSGMHQEGFGSEKNSSTEVELEYMEKIKSFITRISTAATGSQYKRTVYELSTDARQESVDCGLELGLRRRVACRVIDVFVRNVCILRPLSENGRLRITADVAQLEVALAPLCDGKFSDLGDDAEMLHKLRNLLDTPPMEFLSEENMDRLALFPPSYFSLYVVAKFSSEEVQSRALQIHDDKDQSIAEDSEISEWLGRNQSEVDRLAAVKFSLTQLVVYQESQGTPLEHLKKLLQLVSRHPSLDDLKELFPQSESTNFCYEY